MDKGYYFNLFLSHGNSTFTFVAMRKDLVILLGNVLSCGTNIKPECCLQSVTVETAQGVAYEGKRMASTKICGVSILRAGETMEQAVCDVCKDIRIGKILIQTNLDTGEPEVTSSALFIFHMYAAHHYMYPFDYIFHLKNGQRIYCRCGQLL
jgi:uracil phosphoribosyltransferase